MRRIGIMMIMACMLALYSLPESKAAVESEEKNADISLIVEVEGDPNVHKEYFERHYPGIRVVAVYEKLFKGLAIKGHRSQMGRVRSLDFIAAVHPVQTYKTTSIQTSPMFQKRSLARQLNAMKTQPFVFPNELNDTKFTGKGVKVGVVDTGIDYTHPDLARNFKGGFDAVDLDRDPMETKPDQGIPTLHGSHVAGIIGANGNLKGVAPDAEIYGYRALGPGGSGTSVQVIAAMEEAVKDGVDIMNLSLGNTVNGPDYPTSLAVNRARELGVLVVVANGNDGPSDWTVGSPATANFSLSVGAASHEETVPVLEETLYNRKFPINLLSGSPPWSLNRGLYAVNGDDPGADLTGKIALMRRGNKIPFADKAIQAQERGAAAVLIYNNEDGDFQGSVDGMEEVLLIPVASLSAESGEWLSSQISRKHQLYLNLHEEKIKAGTAAFSSRGPVAMNWRIKPDLIAPGTNIVSTVPNGYEALQGTSMATPHIAGVAALMKEAHPDWSNEKIVSAMKSTAEQLKGDGVPLAPNVQGMGKVRPSAAINAEVIIDESLLSFGKAEKPIEKRRASIKIENLTKEARTIQLRVPNKKQGLIWHLPQTFTIPAGGKKKVEIGLDLRTNEIEEGINEGWIELSHGNGKTIQLPYMFINKTADDPKASGLEFSLKPFENDMYTYQLNLGAGVKRAEVSLYNPDSLVRVQDLLVIDKPIEGMNEGEIPQKEAPAEGIYFALITVEMEDGSFQSSESWIEVK
ncbi:S8 family serine peptidase [Aciduricibacillus chroicocephali]|uniref:S8 family serine peptidase n=1 Tax=Aciduricibacillus chroicocephali TaxID=3054939 RepID=A0ABY9KTY0_9BACI|nr:S8 family serine peptidase [Bacillaceae bacterium 44XB]